MVSKLERVASDVPGLDQVLCGGLIAGSSYILQGQPGAGKTILANQIAFGRARRGEHVLYVTLLAESQDRLFQSLSTLDFFDRTKIGSDLMYMSLFSTLRDQGLPALVAALRREMTRHNCTMLILDGLLNARDRGDTNLDIKSFVAEIQGHTAFSNCTVLFLTSAYLDESSPEPTMVDGVIQLSGEDWGARTFRHLRIAKSRGSAAISGLHQYEIKSTGLMIYPRLESCPLSVEIPDNYDPDTLLRVTTGVDGLDECIGGGLSKSSVSLLLGPSGSGKTTFGLNFAMCATEEEPALFLSFYESPTRIAMKAKALGFNPAKLIDAGHLRIVGFPLTEHLNDEVFKKLLETIAARGVKRLVIDGIAAFANGALQPERLPAFLATAINELRARDVTTIVTQESPNSSEWDANPPLIELPSMTDNLILLRRREQAGKMLRLLLPMKFRDSWHSDEVQVCTIGKGGLSLQRSEQPTAGTLPSAPS